MRLRRIGLGLVCGALAAIALTPAAHADGATFSLVDVGPFGGEPSLTSSPQGVLYISTPSGKAPVYRSTDGGASWTGLDHTGWTGSGDDCLATDQAGSLYWCNLGQTTQGKAPLQADAWKSTVAATCTDAANSCAWVHGAGAIPDQCDTSCNPFGVDRQWMAASIPPGGTTDTATAVLMYHDFYGPSSIWVNISTDGGKTYGAPVNAIASANPGAAPGTLEAEGYTFCSTVPAGVGIVPNGQPHAGRIIVGWIASDAPSDASGCNISMADAFHTLWVSYSDDAGKTWTPQQAFDGGIGHDASTPFVGFTLDDQGNPYFGFDMLHWDANPATNAANVQACASEAQSASLQTDTRCNYDMYVVWSSDAGATWDGGGGLIPGSAAAPYQVNPPDEVGTRFFPTIAAGDPGRVAVGFLRTPTIEPSDALGKVLPGGCAGPAQARPGYPTKCRWDAYQAISTNLGDGTANATWTSTDLTTAAPMHTGDICTLGIACVGTLGANRSLLDFNQETVDPTTGCAHMVYADNNAGDTATAPASPASAHNAHLVSVNQTSGPSLIGSATCGAPVAVAEVGRTAALGAGGLAVIGVVAWSRRRRVRRQPAR